MGTNAKEYPRVECLSDPDDQLGLYGIFLNEAEMVGRTCVTKAQLFSLVGIAEFFGVISTEHAELMRTQAKDLPIPAKMSEFLKVLLTMSDKEIAKYAGSTRKQVEAGLLLTPERQKPAIRPVESGSLRHAHILYSDEDDILEIFPLMSIESATVKIRQLKMCLLISDDEADQLNAAAARLDLPSTEEEVDSATVEFFKRHKGVKIIFVPGPLATSQTVSSQGFTPAPPVGGVKS
jgi:hypothetical protein